MARRDQTLYRDESDKMLGGVCSGIAQYFDVDTNLVRVAFVVLAAFGGGGVLGYLILWAILDPKPAADPLPPVTPEPEIVLNEPDPMTQNRTPSTQPVETAPTEGDPVGETPPAG
ncbi:MAG: PspC domain-containing protein [Acidimicrobiales bacterium]|nr:PspC domain-containing protein [Acidimicrobiales bacterium]